MFLVILVVALKSIKKKHFKKENLAPKYDLKNAKLLGKNSVMFLVHPTLSADELEKTSQVLNQVFSRIQKYM